METLREIWEYDRKSIDNAPTIREWYDHWIVDDSGNIITARGIDNTYIVYNFPHTKKDKEQFKDILDSGNTILVPYVKNSGLSSIREFPIVIRNKYGGKYIGITYGDGFRKYVDFKMHDILSNHIICETITDYSGNCIDDRLKRYVFVQ